MSKEPTEEQKTQLAKIAKVRIRKILHWHKKNKWFDIAFVSNVLKVLESDKCPTPGQLKGIENIYNKYNLGDYDG